MYPLGHFGIALLFAAPVAAVLHPQTQTGFTVYMMLTTWFPDFDQYIPGLVHHGITHVHVRGHCLRIRPLGAGVHPVRLGFAAGAMIYLVFTELLREGLKYGENLSSHGYPAMVLRLLGVSGS